MKIKCYIKVENNVIKMLGMSSKVPWDCTEIEKKQYDYYKSILASIPNKSGYTKKVTLYIDGKYDVDYTAIVEAIEDNAVHIIADEEIAE